MFFYRRKIPGLAIYSYLIGDETSRQCVVIDPARDVDDYLTIANEQGLNITHVFETHVHADYVCGSKELKARLDGKPEIFCSGMGGKEWTPTYADVVVKDGDEINVGTLRFRVIHTPGHTPEHIMWVLYENDQPSWLFTGDFLFVGDVGRPDLLGTAEQEKLAHQLYDSVFQILPEYPDSTEIFPTHGAGSLCGKAIRGQPSTTLGLERESNLALEKKSEEQWINDLMEEMPPAPPYFPRMKKVNVVGPKVIGSDLPGKKRLNPAEVKEQKDAIVLDVRSKEEFSEAHIPGSINIPFSPALSSWAGWVLPDDKPIILVMEETDHLDETIKMLLRVGYDHILGYLVWGINTQLVEKQKIMTVDDLKKEPYFVLDVRTDREWNEGHIKGATHIHAGLVTKNIDKIPKDKPVAIICGSGYRASLVASLLKKEGFDNAINVFGGMTAWKNKDYPITKE